MCIFYFTICVIYRLPQKNVAGDDSITKLAHGASGGNIEYEAHFDLLDD